MSNGNVLEKYYLNQTFSNSFKSSLFLSLSSLLLISLQTSLPIFFLWRIKFSAFLFYTLVHYPYGPIKPSLTTFSLWMKESKKKVFFIIAKKLFFSLKFHPHFCLTIWFQLLKKKVMKFFYCRHFKMKPADHIQEINTVYLLSCTVLHA